MESPTEVPPPQVDTIQALSAKKLQMTTDYCRENYGFNHHRLDTPRIVVVHYTAIPDLQATLDLFKRDFINESRDDIKNFSQLNVGIHYVVAKDGKIFTLIPDSVVARHVIGFNHVALGIENVAADSSDLTPGQLESNVALIKFLANKYRTIQFVVGHDESSNRDLPHFRFFLAKNAAYQPHGKADPGPNFMALLRTRLRQENVTLEK